jgi:hypothetical protein
MSFSLRTGKGQRIAFKITGRKGAGFGREQEIVFLAGRFAGTEKEV